MLDIILTNGRIVDGTSNPWLLGDVGVKKKRPNRSWLRGKATLLNGQHTHAREGSPLGLAITVSINNSIIRRHYFPWH